MAERCVRCGAGEERGDLTAERMGERGVETLGLGEVDGEARGEIMPPSIVMVGVRGILTCTDGNPNSKYDVTGDFLVGVVAPAVGDRRVPEKVAAVLLVGEGDIPGVIGKSCVFVGVS